MEAHPKPYKVERIKKGSEVTVNRTYFVPFSIGKSYQNHVHCEVVEMDACHLLLGRPWKIDLNAKHLDRENSYSFQWDKKEDQTPSIRREYRHGTRPWFGYLTGAQFH